MNEHNTTELICYLEIAATANRGRNDSARYSRAMAELRTAIIADCPVAHVIRTSADDPAHVPDFGHNYRCQCSNERNWAAYGVLRYSGVTLIVTGDPQLDVFGDYQINGHARLTVCGKGPKPQHGTAELKQLARVTWN